MSQLIERIAEIASKAGVQAAYGDPVKLDGTTVIPVAATWHGFFGGEGGSEGTVEGEGSGGGGGGASLPLGAYITRDGDTRFEPNIITLIGAAIPLVCATGYAMGRILRGLRGRR